jgi:hypothetical protein
MRVSQEPTGLGTISVPIMDCHPARTSRMPQAAATQRAASGTAMRGS